MIQASPPYNIFSVGDVNVAGLSLSVNFRGLPWSAQGFAFDICTSPRVNSRCDDWRNIGDTREATEEKVWKYVSLSCSLSRYSQNYRLLSIKIPMSVDFNSVVSVSGDILIKFYALESGGDAQLDYLALDVVRSIKAARSQYHSYYSIVCMLFDYPHKPQSWVEVSGTYVCC